MPAMTSHSQTVQKLLSVIDPPPSRDGPADALSQPTRARLFALLAERGQPAGTAELAEQLGLHPNRVRTHLDRLQRAGLVVRARPRKPRGRPPDAWTIAPDARPGGRAPSAYQDLGRWLARALRAGPGALRSIENTGRQIGHELPTADTPKDPDVLESTFAALGFQPTVTVRDDDRLTLCACATAPTARQSTKTSRRSARCTKASPTGCSTFCTRTPSSSASSRTTRTKLCEIEFQRIQAPDGRTRGQVMKRHPL